MYDTFTNAELFRCATHGRFVFNYALAEFHAVLLNDTFSHLAPIGWQDAQNTPNNVKIW